MVTCRTMCGSASAWTPRVDSLLRSATAGPDPGTSANAAVPAIADQTECMSDSPRLRITPTEP
jgi:hypothetical protein